MANFDWGLLGDLLKRDREEWGAMPYDSTQPYNGVAADWLNAANNAVASEALAQGLLGEQVKPAEAKTPETKPVSLPIMTPQQPQQQEQPEVTQQVNPVNQEPGGQQAKAETLASGGASEGSQAMAKSAEQENVNAAQAGKELEAKRDNMMAETSQQSQQAHQQKLQEEQSFESFLGGLLGLGLNSLIPDSFFLKKAGIMHK